MYKSVCRPFRLKYLRPIGIGKATEYASDIECVRLIARDTGVGMDDVTRMRVFDPFFTTREVGQGTGLGLSVVYGLVSRSGGRIRAESKLGQGTAFIIEWPVFKKPE